MLEFVNRCYQPSQKKAEIVPSYQVLRTHFLFSAMPTEQLLRLIRHMEKVACPSGSKLVEQGETDASDFFIVLKGEMEVSVIKTDGNGSFPVVVAKLGPSATLGEMALLCKCRKMLSFSHQRTNDLPCVVPQIMQHAQPP